MGNTLNVCLYNTDPDSSGELVEHIQSLNFVRIVGELCNPEELANALSDGGINLVFFHLDPDFDPVVDIIDQVATRYPDLAMIAISHQTDPQAILAPMRVGCEQFVCEPIDPADLASAVSRVAGKRLLSQPTSRCLCITGASGGAGTTSIACNLAMEIGQITKRDCALLDLDLQFGDVAVNFDCDARYTLFDLASAGADLDEDVLSSAINSLSCNVAILSRPEQIDQQEMITPDTIHRVVELLLSTYENVVIDLPRDMNPCTMAAVAHADVVFLVCQLLVPSVRNAKRYHDALQNMGVPDERLEFIINRTDGRNSRLGIEDIEETIKKPVYACIPNDYQFVARSIDFGRPIASLDKDNAVRTAIRKMAHKVLTDTSTEPAGKGKRRGFFGRLLAK